MMDFDKVEAGERDHLEMPVKARFPYKALRVFVIAVPKNRGS